MALLEILNGPRTGERLRINGQLIQGSHPLHDGDELKICDMALAFRRDTELARSLAELAILRTAQVLDCPYICSRHLSLARACGVTDRQIEELARWPDSAAFTPAQKAALRFVEQAAQQTRVADGVFLELRRYCSPREIVELTMLVGFYVSTAIFIKALAVPDEKAD